MYIFLQPPYKREIHLMIHIVLLPHFILLFFEYLIYSLVSFSSYSFILQHLSVQIVSTKEIKRFFFI